MGDVLVWTCDVHGYTPERAIHEFAATHWDKPRKARLLQHKRFKITDGVATYRIEQAESIWQIWREWPNTNHD